MEVAGIIIWSCLVSLVSYIFGFLCSIDHKPKKPKTYAQKQLELYLKYSENTQSEYYRKINECDNKSKRIAKKISRKVSKYILNCGVDDKYEYDLCDYLDEEYLKAIIYYTKRLLKDKISFMNFDVDYGFSARRVFGAMTSFHLIRIRWEEKKLEEQVWYD